LARELIEASLKDIEDTRMASRRLETRDPALNAADARKAGLGGSDPISP
jgi:predicted DNA-binding protein